MRLVGTMNACPFVVRCPVWRDLEFRNVTRVRTMQAALAKIERSTFGPEGREAS
jgi:hypothetical protein